MKTLPLAVLMLFGCAGTKVGETRVLSSTLQTGTPDVIAGSQGTEQEASGWLDAITGLDWYQQLMILAATVGLVIIFRKPLGALLTKVVKRKGAAKKD